MARGPANRRYVSDDKAPRIVTPNPSIERTPSGRLRLPTVTAHVERYIASLSNRRNVMTKGPDKIEALIEADNWKGARKAIIAALRTQPESH